MRRTAVLSALLFSAAVSAAAQAWHPGTLDEAVALAKARSKLVLVDFYSDG